MVSNEIHRLLRRTDARKAMTSFTVYNAYHYFVDQA